MLAALNGKDGFKFGREKSQLVFPLVTGWPSRGSHTSGHQPHSRSSANLIDPSGTLPQQRRKFDSRELPMSLRASQ
jgi:hypothetical protein